MATEPDSDICTIVIFGGGGDLAMRMLYPSLYFLHCDGLLPDGVRVIGVGRSEMDDTGFRNSVHDAFGRFVAAEHVRKSDWERFAKRLSYVALDVRDPAAYAPLAKAVGDVSACDLIAYLSTPPDLFGVICENMHKAGLVGSNTRVAMEKPIGHDLMSSHRINDALSDIFDENRIFRVDHYLGKETVQNLLALRFGNVLFEPLWNARTVEQVQITVSEKVGMEGRWSYYDNSGALRDMLQNHMLQLLCLVAMEPPTNMDPDAVRDEKLKVLRSLRPITGAEVDLKTVRGQYTAGVIDGQSVPGYAEEEGGRQSDNETFVALRADIDNWRWAGVPFYLRTGKRLPYRYTEIFIQFRHVPHSIFADATGHVPLHSNKLVIRLQPEENIKLALMNKLPGLDGMHLQEVALNLSLADAFKAERRRIAYERLLLDILGRNTTLFVRRDEVEAAWGWIDDIVDGWAAAGMKPKPYAAGTWGPASSIALTERNGHTWHE